MHYTFNWSMIFFGFIGVVGLYFLINYLIGLFNQKKPPQDHYYAERKKEKDK
jgi:hypothetical protein